MALVASDITNDARATLIDDDLATWSAVQLRGFVTDAERMVSFYKPDAYTKHEFVPMVAGTNQDLPVDGIAILDVNENEVSRRAATLVERELLDTENRFWRAATGEVDVQHWCADARDPRRFDITPPNDGSGSVRVLYGAAPPALTSEASPIVLVDTYKYTLYCFTLHRAYAENSRKGDVQKADYWLQKGLQALGIKSAAQVQVAPKVSASVGE
jgi:hypothetical protein